MVTAADVKKLREETGLPLMDCKKALTENGGDAEQAKVWLRERGLQLNATRQDRATDFGRFGLYAGDSVGAIVELMCESAPVVQNEQFVQLANDLAQQLATGPGAADAEALLAQDSPSRPGTTLGEQKDELFNRIREVFRVGRMERFECGCGAYLHPGSHVHGVLLAAEGGTPQHLKDLCMHIAALSPASVSVDELDPQLLEGERKILREAALQEGKPESIVDKMVEGRMRNFYAERVFLEQPFVKAENKETVAEFCQQNGIQAKKFVHWVIGQA